MQTTTMHNDAEFWASAAAVGGLSEAELEAWNEHVAGCPACKEKYNEEITMSKAMKQTIEAEGPDPGFERRMISKFRQVHPTNGNKRADLLSLFPILAGGVACLALLVLIGIASSWKGEKAVVAGSASPAIQTQGTVATTVPDAVEKTIRANLNGRTVSNVVRREDNEDVSYAVEARDGTGQEWDMTVDEDGTLLNIDTDPTELPAAVQTALQAQVGPGRLNGVEKLFDDGETTYRAGITAPNDVQRDYTFATDGTLLSEEVNLSDLAPAIQAAITSQVGTGRLVGIDKTFDDEEVTYEATMAGTDGRERDFSVSKEGKLLSREVSLEEVPAAVQQTIAQTLGTGKVVGIDQSFAGEAEAMAYEVEGQKDGKPFNFIASATGRLLGMEE